MAAGLPKVSGLSETSEEVFLFVGKTHISIGGIKLKRIIVVFAAVLATLLHLNIAIAETKETKVNMIPISYNLTFEQAMKMVDEQHLIIKCLGVNSRYNKRGVGFGVTGYNPKSWDTERSFHIFVPYSKPAYSRPAKCTLKWYSSLTKESGSDHSFVSEAKFGLNHIHVSLYRDDILSKTGNYYLKAVPQTTEKQCEVIKLNGTAKNMIEKYVRGETAEALFQLADTDSIAVKTGVKAGVEVVEIDTSSEIAHANTITKSVKVGIKDDGKSIMFPAEQPVLVLTITEKLTVDRKGNAIKSVSIEKAEKVMLTIKKIRKTGGEYKWRKK